MLHFDSFKAYRQTDAVNASLLKDLRKSPLNAFGPEIIKDSSALNFGRMYHEFILEPQTFEQNYYAFDETERPEPGRTFAAKANKEWKAEKIAEAGERPLVTRAELLQMEQMREMLRTHAGPATNLISASSCEASIYADLELDGGQILPVKARYDVINPERGAIMDLKTTQNATPRGFEVEAGKYAYHVQAAFYVLLAERIFKKPFKFYFLTQETAAPYNTLLREVSNEMIEKGRYELDKLLPAVAHIRETGEIQSYNSFTADPFGILPMDIPNYYVLDNEFNFLSK